jgi:two-component system, NtrC family, C4-dicarboxylate transport response regulator DctD
MTKTDKPCVLLVEDDVNVQLAVTQTLQLSGFEVICCDSAENALTEIKSNFAGVVISDVRLPKRDGLALLRDIRRIDPELPVTLITGHGDVVMAVEAMREGAWDFIEKPFASERLIDITRRAYAQRHLVLENRRLKAALDGRSAPHLIGQTPAVERVRTLVATLGTARVDVLIEGETGSGKEVVARALHDASGATGPFVAINCGALPETVFESEIFGAEAGAYTGANKRRIGKLEFAQDGTVFLDEIESMPTALQVKMLRVLQERTVERLGSNTAIPLLCRIVAATKVDLKQLAANGGFREDLYYRLNVATIRTPPLRERQDDIPLLLMHFAERASLRFQRPVLPWSMSQITAWKTQSWPGNVRELRNFAERWVLGLEQSEISASNAAPIGLTEQLECVERTLIDRALQSAHGSVASAADSLAVPRKTLHDKLKRLGLDPRVYRATGAAMNDEQ